MAVKLMYNKSLCFDEEGNFRILLLGDPHEKPDIVSDNGRARYLDMLKFYCTAADTLKPDLVVFMGDLCVVSAEDEDFSEYMSQVERLVRPFTDRCIPFATVMGNHDHDSHTEERQIQLLESMEMCLTRRGSRDIKGVSNYNIPVLGQDGKPAFNLWFFDSNNLYPEQNVSIYDIVDESQIRWYEETAAALREENAGKPLPAVAFQHIPVIEEYRLLRKARPHEMWKAVRGNGKFRKNWYVLEDESNGYLAEGPCSPDINSGQFESWKRTGDIKGAFFGHDHMNNFAGEVDGILLAQCKTSAFRAYTDGGRPAVRLVTLHEQSGDFDTDVYSFKDFGLKCTCLGPIESRITDRQSVNATIAFRAAAAGAVFATACIGAKKIYRAMKK